MRLNKEKGYFINYGTNVMAFDDIYPAGHQSGVSVIMHGKRIATNGDIRFEQTPGQWQPVSKQNERVLDEKSNSIKVSLSYPNEDYNLKDMNPQISPDVNMDYEVTVTGQDSSVLVTVNMPEKIPEQFAGKICFNLELFPGELFGKSWIMDGRPGIFPRQVNGPVKIQPTNFTHSGHYADPYSGKKVNPFIPDGLLADRELLAGLPGKNDPGYDPDGIPAEYNPIIADDMIAEEYASGHRFVLCPEDPYMRMTVECLTEETDLKLYDGRLNHNNGWFVLSSAIPADRTGEVLKWRITPNAVREWRYKPVIQVSQVGYHPGQNKVAIIEMDARDRNRDAEDAIVYELTETGFKKVLNLRPASWGDFLRYHYMAVDFSDIRKEGLYCIKYADSSSTLFKISEDVYDRGVWQPVLEYFLPVQMCHMRVNEKYRVWHGLCHKDDAKMAKTGFIHFDGYSQGDSTLTKYKPGDAVPGLNRGGWHDAGDFDLRIESQSGEAYILSLIYKEFNVQYDATTIDQDRQVVEIHQPDGKNDILQQIEHGLLTVLGGYHSLGRHYRGIICSRLRQYVLLGDASAMTDGETGDDDRWVFTEDNPPRQYMTAAHLAAASEAMQGYNDSLSEDCIETAAKIYEDTTEYLNTDFLNTSESDNNRSNKDLNEEGSDKNINDNNARFDNSRSNNGTDEKSSVKNKKDIPDSEAESERVQKEIRLARYHAAAELYIATGDSLYREHLIAEVSFVSENIREAGWIAARVIDSCNDSELRTLILPGIKSLASLINKECTENPYGIPYKPYIWGAGWGIQTFARQVYFLHKAFPEYFEFRIVENALHFILGCHPGSNTASFASGVGTKSATTAYGANRADWSYIPGGVISGTALIRPDFPELLKFPFLWQQTEYVLGGGSSNYMFLVLAVQHYLEKR